MTTWGDVLKALVVCAAALFLVMAIIWAMETNMEIRSLQSDVAALKEAQRPLVTVNGKYPHIVTTRGEVFVQEATNE